MTASTYNTGTYPAHGKTNLGDFLNTWQGRLLFGQAVRTYLELSCFKKLQKKFQPRNWFGEYGTYEGSE